MKTPRPEKGRMLFYTRDSGGKHEMTPAEYVRRAAQRAQELGLTFSGSPEQIETMVKKGNFAAGDIYFDIDVKGNILSRPAWDALVERVKADPTISHVAIPRRDRLARPDHPLEGMALELKLRSIGVTLVFNDRICPPLKLGARDQISDMILSLVDYDQAGEERRKLAEKVLFAQLALAAAGFSTGGRAPYGFRRWLVRVDGTLIRELQDGERIRMAGHHVVWMPVDDQHQHMQIIRRILRDLETIPASRIAAQLTAEGIPSPDSGRFRKDKDILHEVSGVWHQNTVTGIARNPLLQALTTYGRRSMGDQLRFAPEGPRAMVEEDYRTDMKPKIVRNPENIVIKGRANFEPCVDVPNHEKLLEKLDERGGTQRNKPRSRDPNRNPLGARLFDLACTWPMYRVPNSSGFDYKCGLYMQTHGGECAHNKVDGTALTKTVLAALQQKLLTPTAQAKLKERLQQLAASEESSEATNRQIEAKRNQAREIERQLEKVERNLAWAESEDQFRAVAKTQTKLRADHAACLTELQTLQAKSVSDHGVEQQVATALEAFDRLPELVDNVENLAAITAAFALVDVRVYLGFQPVQRKKRVVNRVACGKVTFGNEKPPIEVYQGPTGRRAMKGNQAATFAAGAGGELVLSGPFEPIGRKSC